MVVSGSLEMVETSPGGSSTLEQRGGEEGIGVSFSLRSGIKWPIDTIVDADVQNHTPCFFEKG